MKKSLDFEVLDNTIKSQIGTIPIITGEWASIIKSQVSSSRQNLCNAMDDFHAISLINAINDERTKRGHNTISPSNDMCATALFKGLVQKVISYQ